MLTAREIMTPANDADFSGYASQGARLRRAGVSIPDFGSTLDVIDLMLEHQIDILPVTGRRGELVGYVSYVDVLCALPLPEPIDEARKA